MALLTAAEIVQHADLCGVARALGFSVGRTNRAPCLLCGSANPTTLSLNQNQKSWYCFRCHRSGGLLDLIQAVHGGSRAEAAQWLADVQGLRLTDRPMDPAARERYAKRHNAAKRAADGLVERRRTILNDLIRQRNHSWRTERSASGLARRLLAEGKDNSPLWHLVWRHALDNIEGDRVNTELERIESLRPEQFRAEFGRGEGLNS